MHIVSYHTKFLWDVLRHNLLTHTYRHTRTFTHTHTLAVHKYRSIAPPWRRLTGPDFLQIQQVTHRPTVCSLQDLSRWQSNKTGRGPLEKGWRDNHKPIMCSYKRVQCSFEVYGLQTRTEEFIHKVRQSFFSLYCCKEGWIKIGYADNVMNLYRYNTRWKNFNV